MKSPMGSSLGDIHSIVSRGKSSRSGVPHADGAYEGEPLIEHRRPKPREVEQRISVGALSPGDHFKLIHPVEGRSSSGKEGMVLLKGQFEAEPQEYTRKSGGVFNKQLKARPTPKRTNGIFTYAVLVALSDVRVILAPNVEVVIR